MNNTEIVKSFYNGFSEGEWKRIEGRPEFLITCRYLDRYIKPGDRVFDIGGGPGRYSLYLASRGCDVTLLDLSESNVRFASDKAKESHLSIKTICGDARYADTLVGGDFDAVLLMGPLYHLLEEDERILAVNSALSRLKSHGKFFASFISMAAGIIYGMKFAPEIINSTVECEQEYHNDLINKKSFAGDAFTRAVFTEQSEILPFMAQFPLKKLHLFGQEGVTSPCENNIMNSSPEVIDGWIDLSEKLCEREEFLSWSEHIMYVGEKI